MRSVGQVVAVLVRCGWEVHAVQSFQPHVVVESSEEEVLLFVDIATVAAASWLSGLGWSTADCNRAYLLSQQHTFHLVTSQCHAGLGNLAFWESLALG